VHTGVGNVNVRLIIAAIVFGFVAVLFALLAVIALFQSAASSLFSLLVPSGEGWHPERSTGSDRALVERRRVDALAGSGERRSHWCVPGFSIRSGLHPTWESARAPRSRGDPRCGPATNVARAQDAVTRMTLPSASEGFASACGSCSGTQTRDPSIHRHLGRQSCVRRGSNCLMRDRCESRPAHLQPSWRRRALGSVRL
jgi:hypothetical protein